MLLGSTGIFHCLQQATALQRLEHEKSSTCPENFKSCWTSLEPSLELIVYSCILGHHLRGAVAEWCLCVPDMFVTCTTCILVTKIYRYAHRLCLCVRKSMSSLHGWSVAFCECTAHEYLWLRLDVGRQTCNSLWWRSVYKCECAMSLHTKRTFQGCSESDQPDMCGFLTLTTVIAIVCEKCVCDRLWFNAYVRLCSRQTVI